MTRWKHGFITLAALMVLPAGNADAQTQTDVTKIAAAVAAERPAAIRESLANLDYRAVEASPNERDSAVRASSGKRQRSLGSKVVGGVAGAAAGFLFGGFMGALIQGECRCDDPGLTGFIIGAPIGAMAGGILGAKF